MRRLLLLGLAIGIGAACTSTLSPELPARAVQLTVEKLGAGTIRSEPPGIVCGTNDASCAWSFSAGESVRLIASTALDGVRLGTWSGATCAGAECAVVLDGSLTVGHTFLQRLLVVPTTGGPAIGTVTTTSGAISCPPTCAAWLSAAPIVDLGVTDATRVWWKTPACSDMFASTCALDFTRPRRVPVRGADRGQPLWVLAWGTPAQDLGNGVALFDGDLYLAGSGGEGLSLGAFASHGGADALFARVRAGNGTLVSARAAGGTLVEIGDAVAVSPAGSYFSGRFASSPATFGDPEWDLTPEGTRSGFAAAFDAGGALVWTTAGFHANGIARAIDARAGKVAIVGFETSGSYDTRVALHDAATGVRLWTRPVVSASDELLLDVAIDAAGDVYAAGQLSGPISFGSSDTASGSPISVSSSGLYDGLLLKLRGSDGKVLWARAMGNTLQDNAVAVTLGAGGQPFVTGTFGSTFTIDGIPITHTGTSSLDVYVISFTPAGVARLGFGFGSASADYVNDLAIDPAAPNDLALGGVVSGPLDLPGTAFDDSGGDTSNDGWVALLSTAGTATIWGRVMRHPGANEHVHSIAYSATSGLYATGLFQGVLPLSGVIDPVSNGAEDGFLLRFVP